MSDPLVTTAWLAGRLGDPDVQVVDASWRMPGDATTGREDYDAGHIPGAVFFDIDEIADRASDLPHMLPSPEQFAAEAGALGLRREATVVVYDALGIFSGPRVWWTLRTMGFPKVFVLDGGLKVWRAEGRPVEVSTPAPHPTRLTPAFQPALVRGLAEVASISSRHTAQIVDARAGPRFRGEAPEPRHGLRSGHMPGARNVPWSDLVNADGTLKPAAELKAAFEAAAWTSPSPSSPPAARASAPRSWRSRSRA